MNKIIWEIDSDGNLINQSNMEMTVLSSRQNTETTSQSQASEDSLVDPESGNQQLKRAKEYMKTPCGHVFHPICLSKWMEIRMECPYCRQDLPVVDD